MSRLTKRVVDALQPDPASGRDVFRWDEGDGALKGFGVRLKPSGVASYLLQYRNRQGRTRRLALGRVGELTPDQARSLAGKKLRQIREGGDPSADRHAARQAMTLGELTDLYLDEGPAAKATKKASSWAADRSNIERHIRPLLGRKLASALTQADVARFQRDVATGKTAADIKTGLRGRAIVQGGKGTAARSLTVLAAMLQFGVARGVLPVNPAKGVRPYRGQKRERFLSEAEVATLADNLAEMEREGLNPTCAAAIRLLMLTGCRKSEIVSLRWEHVDFERSCLNLPDSKTGAKVVPLAAAALKMLAELRPDDPHKSPWILPNASGARPIANLQKVWETLRQRAEMPELRLHDLRHSFASFAVAGGATLYMVGKVLGHKQSRTTEIYAHLAADPVRAVADRAAKQIAAAMRRGNRRAGKQRKHGAVVVELRPGTR